MSSRTLSSTVKIRTSELPTEALRRYGFFEDHPELDLSRTTDERRQDQHLKDGITNTLYRLELDSIKPSYDVLSKTGFRKGHHLRRHTPDEELIFLASDEGLHIDNVKRPARPYSYVEPRLLRQPFGSRELNVKLRELSQDRPVNTKEVIHREPASRSRASTASYYAQPRNYSFLQNTFPSTLRPISEPEGKRVLSEYQDTLAAPVSTKRQNRWSVYGSAAPSRSLSTPPPESNGSSQVRYPVVGDRLSRRKNLEHSIGVKLAESQTDLDTFNRLLDRKFGGGGESLSSRSNYSVYPTYPSAYYEYTVPRTQYGYNIYSPPTRVTRPSERTVSYGYSDYAPYSSGYFPRYLPSSYNYVDYSTEGFRHEPWYTPYSRGSYYAGSPSVGRYTTRYRY